MGHTRLMVMLMTSSISMVMCGVPLEPGAAAAGALDNLMGGADPGPGAGVDTVASLDIGPVADISLAGDPSGPADSAVPSADSDPVIILEPQPGPDTGGVQPGPDTGGVQPGPDTGGVHSGPDTGGVQPGPDTWDVQPGPDTVGVITGPEILFIQDRPGKGTPDLGRDAESPFMAEVQRRLNLLCAQKCKTELCYLADMSDCRNFITCQRDAMGLYHATLQPCAFGTYWAGLQAQRKITCDVPANVQCTIDYCAGKPEGAVYDHLDGNCKTYWTCQAGKPVPKCCLDGEIYSSERDRCVADRFRRCHHKCPIKIDECRLPETKSEYYDDGNCRTYWNCEDQRPHPVCCPEGESYDVSRGCTGSRTCNDTCPKQYEQDLCLKVGIKKYSLIDGYCRTYMKCNAVEGDERWCCASDHVFDSSSQSCVVKTMDMNIVCTDECPPHYSEECHLKESPGKKDEYLMVVHGVEIPRPCAAGTEFNFSKCGCATPVKSEDNSCNKELEITFDDPTWYRYGSQKEVIITEHGGKMQGPIWEGMKSYRFNGDLYYRTPFFQSQYDNLYIKVVYMPETDAATGRQVILSNCMNLDLGAPSMELYLQNGRLFLDLVTDNVNQSASARQNRPITASVMYMPGLWNNITAVYNGREVYLLNEAQGESDINQQSLSGPISVAAEGLDFGGCYINKGIGEGYVGSIAHLEFSKCLKAEWLENVFPRVPV